MTPLLYAASIYHGDTTVMEKLIAAGADTTAKNKEGLTAFDLAKTYHHDAMVKLLAAGEELLQLGPELRIAGQPACPVGGLAFLKGVQQRNQDFAELLLTLPGLEGRGSHGLVFFCLCEKVT